MTALADTAPHAKVVVADGTVWHESGATHAQELGWNIAAACHVVRALTAAGVPLERACAQFEFRWAATADQFETIAKFRAARRLWARVGEIAGLAPEARRSFHHADASKVMMTRYDPWVNALRSTVACFAAGMGGADAVTILPHDGLITVGGTSLGRRIARNTQTVLQMESNLSRVIDPAGGSWYVEQLTDQLAAAAWAELQRIERAGGIVAAVTAGDVHESLAAARDDPRPPDRGAQAAADRPDRVPGHPRDAAAARAGAAGRRPHGVRAAAARTRQRRVRTPARPRRPGRRTDRDPTGRVPRHARHTGPVHGPSDVRQEPLRGGRHPHPRRTTRRVPGLRGHDRLPVFVRSGVRPTRRGGRRRAPVGRGRADLRGRPEAGPPGVDEEVGAGSDILDVLTRTLDVMQVQNYEVAS